MKRARIGMIAVAVFAMATMAFAQKPDFTGTWTLDPEASGMAAGAPGGAPGGGRMGGGMNAGPMVVKQTADTLTIERTMGENKMTTVYKLDGTESVNKQTMGQMGEVEIKSVAKFDGSKLVITEKRPGRDGNIMETSQVWTVDGSTLTIESTNARGTQKRVYKK